MLLKDYYRSRLSRYTGDCLILGLDQHRGLVEQFCEKFKLEVDIEYFLGRIIQVDYGFKHWDRQLRVYMHDFPRNHFWRAEEEEDFILTEFMDQEFTELIVRLGNMFKHDLEAYGVFVEGKRVYEFWGMETHTHGLFIREDGFTIPMGYNG